MNLSCQSSNQRIPAVCRCCWNYPPKIRQLPPSRSPNPRMIPARSAIAAKNRANVMVEDSGLLTKSSRIIVERTGRLWGGHHHDTDWDKMQQSESHDDDIRHVATNVRQKLCGYLEELSRWMRQCLVDGQWSSSRWLVGWRSPPPPVMVTGPTTAPQIAATSGQRHSFLRCRSFFVREIPDVCFIRPTTWFSGRSSYECIGGVAQGGDQLTRRVTAARFRWIRHVGPPRTGDRHVHLVRHDPNRRGY
jgi:hypothetical protein